MDAYSNDFKKTVLSWSVTLSYQLVHHEIFYVQVRHCRNVSNRSILLTYQLRRCDDVSAWFRMLKLVTKMGQFLSDTTFFSNLRWFSLIKVPASTSLQHLKDVGLIQLLVTISLRRVKLVISLRYQLVRCYDV